MNRFPHNEVEARRLLKAITVTMMCADNPANLDQEEIEALTEFANDLAIEQGFENWVDAYHKL